MTEKKSEEILQSMRDDLKNYGLTAKYEGVRKMQETAVNIALKALEEIQKYRSIGTVEKCNIYKRIAETTFSAACLDMKIIDELHEYKSIGTVEKFREAVERQRVKNPIKINWGIYDFSIGYECPRCREDIDEGDHHCRCGQAISWEESEGEDD